MKHSHVFLPLLATSFLLSACQPANNMAGLDRVYVKPVSLACVESAIKAQPFTANFSQQGDVFLFSLDGYQTRMLNKTLDGKISGYAVTIDGMHKGDKPNDFYKSVKAMETQIYEAITSTCY